MFLQIGSCTLLIKSAIFGSIIGSWGQSKNANVLLTDLMIQIKGNVSNHTMFGPIMSKYLERMSKSNDQILRLAELISNEEKVTIDPDAIFAEIGG